ncbi:hypothetical protein M9H77_04455 [Catharanthus roseus]|uniref:Uncharacterized protein n=1 Tax=Catharanthus roseus TaxID=4058 RepID=A0ACC0CE39_CATRO|nr:hypothetical protein M9H77_04455 [Catharanthus roseus]
MEEQTIQIEKFGKSHMTARNMLRFFREQNLDCTVRYVALHLLEIIQHPCQDEEENDAGRNTVEEVLCLSAQQGYIVFYRNSDGSNLLSDIVVVHPISIQMIRTRPYDEEDVNAHELVVTITDMECGLMPVIDVVFNRSYHMLCRRHIDQNVLAKLTEMIKDEEVASRFINGT